MKNNKNSIFFALFFCLVAFETSCMEKQKRLEEENNEEAPAAKKAKQEAALLGDTQPEVLEVSWTPLHIAAGEGNIAAISALIQAGADKEAKDKDGLTPCIMPLEVDMLLLSLH